MRLVILGGTGAEKERKQLKLVRILVYSVFLRGKFSERGLLRDWIFY